MYLPASKPANAKKAEFGPLLLLTQVSFMTFLQTPLDDSSDEFLLPANLEVLCTHEIAFQQGGGEVLEGNVINGVNESTLKIDF